MNNGLPLNRFDGKSYDDEHGIQRCSCCNAKIAKRKTKFDKVMFRAGLAAFDYCIKNNKQSVRIKDLRTKGLINSIEYGKMNHLVRFGLAFKKPEYRQGEYGIPRTIRDKFLRGERRVAEAYITDPTIPEGLPGRREMTEKRLFIEEIPTLERGDYVSYIQNT